MAGVVAVILGLATVLALVIVPLLIILWASSWAWSGVKHVYRRAMYLED